MTDVASALSVGLDCLIQSIPWHARRDSAWKPGWAAFRIEAGGRGLGKAARELAPPSRGSSAARRKSRSV